MSPNPKPTDPLLLPQHPPIILLRVRPWLLLLPPLSVFAQHYLEHTWHYLRACARVRASSFCWLLLLLLLLLLGTDAS